MRPKLGIQHFFARKLFYHSIARHIVLEEASQYDGAPQTIRTAPSLRRKREKAIRPTCIGERMLRPASRTVSRETVSASADVLYGISY